VDKIVFLVAYIKARDKALTVSNIEKSWKKSGLHPFLPSLVIEKLPVLPPLVQLSETATYARHRNRLFNKRRNYLQAAARIQTQTHASLQSSEQSGNPVAVKREMEKIKWRIIQTCRVRNIIAKKDLGRGLRR
jgi:hypothetical protein